MKNLIVSVLIALLFLASCTKEENNILPINGFGSYNYNYAPLDIGNSWTYIVDSIAYNDFSIPVSVDTFVYYVKHDVTDMDIGMDGIPTYDLSRSTRTDTASNWKLEYMFRIRKSDRELVRNVDNQPVVTMVFPVRENAEWNANAYNAKEKEIFSYHEIHHPEHLDSAFFEHTVKVFQHQVKNLLQDEFEMEQYASLVGLIYKEERYLKTDFEGHVQSGYRLKYRLVSKNF